MKQPFRRTLQTARASDMKATKLSAPSSELVKEVKTIAPKSRQIKRLLLCGADINCQLPGSGYTPLMIAIENQQDRIAEYLLRQGADPLLKNSQKKMASQLIPSTALIYPILKDYELLFATRENDFETVESVISAGALVNFQGPGGYTSLMIAAEMNNIELVEFFLSLGADMSLTDANGLIAFHLAKNATIGSLLKNIESVRKEAENSVVKISHRFFNFNSTQLT